MEIKNVKNKNNIKRFEMYCDALLIMCLLIKFFIEKYCFSIISRDFVLLFILIICMILRILYLQ